MFLPHLQVHGSTDDSTLFRLGPHTVVYSMLQVKFHGKEDWQLTINTQRQTSLLPVRPNAIDSGCFVALGLPGLVNVYVTNWKDPPCY